MFDRLSHSFLCALLLALSILVFAGRILVAGVRPLLAGLGLAAPNPKQDLCSKSAFVQEFRFERAIEAYEQLIDATFAEGRV